VHNGGVRKPKKRIGFVFVILIGLLVNTSCTVLSNSCASLLKEIKSKESMGQILFDEFELQLNRYKEDSPYPLRLKESAEDLLVNYIEVHKLILEKPECLVKPELEAVLKGGVPKIEARIEQVKESHDAAYILMLGELSEAYQSMELWIKQ
jgi:hypothetical protein